MDIYFKKYLKYKSKYVELRDEMRGGGEKMILFFIPENAEDSKYKDFISKLKTGSIFNITNIIKYVSKFGKYKNTSLHLILTNGKSNQIIKLEVDLNANVADINTQIRNNKALNIYKYLILETLSITTQTYKILYIDL